MKRVTLRPREDGAFDELVAKNVAVHFEMMDDNALWVGIYEQNFGECLYHVNISARGKLTVLVETQVAKAT